MPSDFKQLLHLLEPDNLFLPRQIIARKDLSDQSKIMLGIIFTEHRFDATTTTKEALMNITDKDIEKEFGNNPKVVSRVKSDILKIIENFEEYATQGGI